MPSVTIVGANNTVLTVSLDGTTNLALAQQFAAVVNTASANATLRAVTLDGDVAPSPVPSGELGEGIVLHAGSSVALPTCYTFATDVADGPTTISAGSGDAPLTVLAGVGGLTFNAGPAQVTFLAGGGANVFNGYVSPTGPSAPSPGPSGSSDTVIYAGGGNDTISTGTANSDVFAGGGANIVTLGSGLNHVTSFGRDLILGGEDHPEPGFFDASDINLQGDGTTVIGGSQPLDVGAAYGGATPGGGGLSITLGSGGGTISGGHDSTYNLAGTAFVIGGGNDTVNVATAAATVQAEATAAGTAGPTFVNGPTGAGTLEFIGGSGGSTVAGAAVAVTVAGAYGGDVTFTGAAGGNQLRVYNGFDGNAAVLDASAATGANTFVTGTFITGAFAPYVQPPSTILGGTGADLFVIGSAAASLTGGAVGANTFEFQASLTGGLTDTISDFKAADRLSISGYAANGSAVLADATVSGGSTTITLSDQTRIVLQNFTSLTPGSFS